MNLVEENYDLAFRLVHHESLPPQLHIQRYIKQFPAAGEIVIFDRSWYSAGVERRLNCSRICSP